jgi:hypothetical protein
MESKNAKYPITALFKFVFLTACFVFIVYFFASVILYDLDFPSRLRGPQIVAGICALAAGGWMIWARRTGRGNNKLYSLLTSWGALPAYLLFYFVCGSLLAALLEPGMGAPTKSSHEAFSATEKILIESGYCKNKQIDDPQHPYCAGGPGAAGTSNIPGGFEGYVWGVSDPDVQKRIEQVYLDMFHKDPKIKHIIIYFDPNPVTQKQSKSDDTFIEMRRK